MAVSAAFILLAPCCEVACGCLCCVSAVLLGELTVLLSGCDVDGDVGLLFVSLAMSGGTSCMSSACVRSGRNHRPVRTHTPTKRAS